MSAASIAPEHAPARPENMLENEDPVLLAEEAFEADVGAAFRDSAPGGAHG